jgi:hypothetical protein
MAKGRSTLILLLSILMLGAFIWFQEMWRAKVPSKEVRRIRLFDLNPETLVSLQFLHTNLVVDCVKENGVWMTGGTDRGLGRADVELVHKMVAGLKSMGKGTTITAEHLAVRGLDAAEYGFDKPTVEIIAVDNKGRHHWLIGRKTPLGDMVYVKQEGEDDIYTVMDMLLSMIPPQPDTLRDRTLFFGKPAGVRRIEIRGSTGFIQILKDPKSEWQIQQPLAVAADPKAVEEFLEKIYQVRIEGFEAENVSDFSVYGLQGETRQISLGGADGTSRMLVIGDEIAEKPGFVYARRADDTAVFSLNAEVLDLLDIKRDSLRDARVLTLPAKDISYISVARGTEQLEFVSDEAGRWTLSNPVMWDADPRAVSDLIEFWDIAAITDFNDTNAPVETAEWTLAFGSAELGQTNRFDVFPTHGAKDGLRLKREGESSVFQINLPWIPDSTLELLRYKDRNLWQLQKGEIQKIVLEKAAQGRQVVERQPDGTFTPVETNTAVQVHSEALERLLDELTVVSTTDYVAYNPHDLSIYGLTDPSVLLHMSLSGTNQLGRVLLVGEEAAQGYYAMVKGLDLVFILDKPLVEILSADLVEEREQPVSNAE